MLAESLILSQISLKLERKQRIQILSDLTQRFSSNRSKLESVEEFGHWKLSGKFSPSFGEHIFYSNAVPLVVLQSYYQGGNNSEPVELSFGHD